MSVALALAVGRPVRCLGQELARGVSVTAENDYFDFWRPPDRRPDDNYTQGARVTIAMGRPPSAVRRFLCEASRPCGSALELGQEMYTPTDDAARPVPGQRPYAGWLYVRGSASSATARTRRTVAVTVGVTGPASLAAQAQEAFHRWIGFRRPLGWAHQIPGEPDFAVRGEVERVLAAPGAGTRWADVTSGAHLTLGTLRTAAGLSGRARVGRALAHPWLVDSPGHRWECYVFVGGQAEAVARDLFLDGATFRASARVAREPLVAAWERGLGVRLSRLGLEYRAVNQSRDYRTGPAVHPFGGLTVTWWGAR